MSNLDVFRTSRSTPITAPSGIAIHDGPKPLAQGSDGPPRNGRVGLPTPRGPFSIRFAVTVADTPQEILGILAASERIYVAGSMVWKLLDANTGAVLALGIRGLGAGVLDGELPLLYQPDKEGQLDALHLDAGQKVFWSPLHLNANLERPFAARVGNSLLLLGRERWQPGAGAFEPSLTCLEALVVGPVPEIRPSGQLQFGGPRPLIWRATRWTAAAWPKGLAIAFPGEIHLVDESLEITRVLTGTFEAVSLSVDERGYMHLLVDESDTRALWIVSPDGVRTLRLPLPKPHDLAAAPPIVLHGRQVLVHAPEGLLCVDLDGATLWASSLAPDGGAVVMADDAVLATDRHELVSFDADGRRTVLHRFDDHMLVGPPVIDDRGEIMLRTKTQVLQLSCESRYHGGGA